MSQFKKDAKVAGAAGLGAAALAAIGPVGDIGMGITAAKHFEDTAPHINPLTAGVVIGGATLIGKAAHSIYKSYSSRKAHMLDAAKNARK